MVIWATCWMALMCRQFFFFVFWLFKFHPNNLVVDQWTSCGVVSVDSFLSWKSHLDQKNGGADLESGGWSWGGGSNNVPTSVILAHICRNVYSQNFHSADSVFTRQSPPLMKLCDTFCCCWMHHSCPGAGVRPQGKTRAKIAWTHACKN